MTSSKSFVKSILNNINSEPYVSKNETWKYTVARIMLTGIFKQQFYRSAEDAIKESITSFEEAAIKDPMYLLKAAIYARRLNLKGVVKLAVAILAAKASDKFLTDNRNNIISLLGTFHPGQLLQFVELQKSKAFGIGFGSRTQKWCQKVMQSWSSGEVETYTLKYPSAMKGLIRLVHPKYNDLRGQVISYVLDASKEHPEYGKSNPKCKRQAAVERIKNNVMTKVEVAKSIIDYNIPWDVIKGFYPDFLQGEVGLAVLTQMGLSALLLNTSSLEKSGLLDTEVGQKTFKLKLNEVKHGRALPIDFAKPYLHTKSDLVKDALVDAIIDSLEINMPEIENRSIGVSIDISGSMYGDRLKTAGLLAIPFLKAKDLWFTTFDDRVWEQGSKFCPVISGKSKRDQVHSMLNLTTYGGTNLSAAIQTATRKKHKLDLMVLITDEIQNCGQALNKAWKQYKDLVNPNAELWICNASNYEFHSADLNDPSITVYQTLTPAIFKNLQFVGQDLVSSIEDCEIENSY